MAIETVCNATLDEMRIFPTSEIKIVGDYTFHELALVIAGGFAALAILISFYLMFMHALHYTRPREQQHIIRILFMVPIYATSSWLSLKFYWHAIYYQVISDCYEAFAISSFFALLCSYIAPDLHEQKEFFRHMNPITPWVWPVNWLAKCCGGQRGPWRTPQSGLTWFNINWIGIYHYCFVRVTATVTAVLTQHFGRYCESSNSPAFAHIWVLVIVSIAVSVAMYCLIQFYMQLHSALAEHKPFLKVLSIKLVIFLSFWQSSAISIGTSTLHIINPNEVLAYPDIKVGIGTLLLCAEMVIFAALHIWAFSWQPYRDDAKTTFYPVPDPSLGMSPRENEHGPRQGGFMGLRAFCDALNIWDVIKAFGRGLRWLFVGVKHRKKDISYRSTPTHSEVDMDDLSKMAGVFGNADTSSYRRGGFAVKGTDHLPIANEFRRSQYLPSKLSQQTITKGPDDYRRVSTNDEAGEGLIAHAQPNPHSSAPPAGLPRTYSPFPEDHRAAQSYGEACYNGARGEQARQQQMGELDDLSVGLPALGGYHLDHHPHHTHFHHPQHRHQGVRAVSLSTVEEEFSRISSREDVYRPELSAVQGPRSPRTSSQMRAADTL